MSNRRVVLLSYYFPPYATVSVFRALRFCRHLQEAGWDPAVVTSEAERGEVAWDENLLRQVPEGLIIRRCPLFRREEQIKAWLGSGRPTAADRSEKAPGADRPVAGQPTWRNLVSELCFAVPDNKVGWRRTAGLATEQLVRERNAEVIFASGPPFSVHLAALDASRRTQVPLVLDFRDPWSRDPWGRRAKSQLAQWRHVAMERTCVREARRVILNTERMADEFRRFYAGQPADKFVCIPNGFDGHGVDEGLAPPPWGENESTRPARFLHPGTLYGQRDPGVLLKAIKRVNQRGTARVEFEQLGSCERRAEVEAVVSAESLADCVRISPPLPHRQALEQMALADVFVIIQQGTTLQVPGKLFEMLPFRKPILAFVDEGATADLIRKYGLGFIAPPKDLEATAKALEAAQAAARSGELRNNFDAAIEVYDGRKLTARLGRELDAVAAECQASRS